MSSAPAVNVTPARGVSRRLTGALVALLIVAVVAAVLIYARGGGTLTGGGGSVTFPVEVGQEFHTFISLDSGGRSVTLVSARPFGVDDGLEADVRLVRLQGGDIIGA